MTKRHRLESTKDALKVAFDLETFIEITQPGWISSSVPDLPQHVFTRAKLQAGYGLRYFCWNGLQVSFPLYISLLLIWAPRRTHLLLDKEHHIIGVLLGQPRDAGLQGVHDGALSALKHVEKAIKLYSPSSNKQGPKLKSCQKCHEPHYSLHHGISFRGGQPVSAASSQLGK
jgi:hypothetical protein